MLDIWGAEEKLLQSKQQLFEITNTRPPKVQPAASSIPQNESTEEQSYASVDSYSYCNKDVTSEEKRPQIIVELQVSVYPWLSKHCSFIIFLLTERGGNLCSAVFSPSWNCAN